MKRNILLYGHANCLNRGCEAIAKGTIEILNSVDGFNYNMTVTSDDKNIDENKNELNVDKVLIHDNYLRYNLPWLASKIQGKLLKNEIKAADSLNKRIINKTLNYDLFISAGGDNYCYQRPLWLYSMNSMLSNKNKKTVLWGCSVEPKAMDKEMIEDLKKYDLIVSRESITYNSLIEKGVNKNTRLCPDPAFVMPYKKVEMPNGLNNKKVVGINLSPLIKAFEGDSNCTFNAVVDLIRHILDNTEYDICLLPHVFVETSNDYHTLELIYKKIDNSRVHLIEKRYNANELKYIISKFELFIGARTHSTIAAYSMCVPTLVLGYSVKARGIAKDIFGDSENYILPVQNIKTSSDLINKFNQLDDNKEDIRSYLNNFIPQYKKKSYEAGKYLVELIKGEKVNV